MPVVHVGPRVATKMTPSDYANEDALEGLLAEHPYLLMDDGEPELCLVRRQVVLHGSGKLDLLLVDVLGRPTVVEVKLRRNGESRREVLAQVFDYVSSLAEMTVRELDRLVGGALETALRSFTDAPGEDEEAAFGARWGACADALRAGNVRVVVAIDSAPPDLVRIVRFVNDHSDLDVRLVEVSRYEEAGQGAILVPKLLVVADEAKTVERRAKAAASDDFLAVVGAYNAACREGLDAQGRGPYFRQIKPEGWPGSLHYEVMDSRRDASFDAEIHLESARVVPLQPVLISLADEIRPHFPHASVSFDPLWSRGRGRLRIRVPKARGAHEAASTLQQLVERTLDRVSEAVAALAGTAPGT